MKIEQYHHDAMDVQTYDALQAMTNCNTGAISDRLVRIYWTYKVWRDKANRSETLSWVEWRYLCIALDIYDDSKDSLAPEIAGFLQRLTATDTLDSEMVKMAFSEAAFHDATHKQSESPVVRRIEYYAAIRGMIPVPEHVRLGLAKQKQRYADIQEANAAARQQAQGDTNGRIRASRLPKTLIGPMVKISHHGTKMGVFLGVDGDIALFQEAETDKKYRLKTIQLLE